MFSVAIVSVLDACCLGQPTDSDDSVASYSGDKSNTFYN